MGLVVGFGWSKTGFSHDLAIAPWSGKEKDNGCGERERERERERGSS